MRKLTFSGFTKRYVKSLSQQETTAVYKLVREAAEGNSRLREPLFLYALSNGCVDTLLTASRKTKLYSAYCELAQKYSYDQMLTALERENKDLPVEYIKVWNSYVSVANKQSRDDEIKALMRKRVIEIQQRKRVSTYRVCKELNLNNANINAWLKNGTPQKVRLDTARTILNYVEQTV